MTFLSLSGVTLQTPDLSRRLILDFTATFGTERTGLIGQNGCGKSSLLRIMTGHIAPTSGSVTQNGRIGFLRQRFEDISLSVSDALGLRTPYDVLNRITSGAGSESDFAKADWTLETRVETALSQVGLHDMSVATALSHLSGGQRMRVSIARTLIENADLLLLDEPTNNLDAEGRTMILDLVLNWRGGVVVAGHDRALLEHMDRTLELSQTGARFYSGGWSDYFAEKTAETARTTAQFERAERTLKITEANVQKQSEKKARRDKAGRAARIQGGAPRVSLDRNKGRSEKSLGRERAVSDTVLSQAQTARDEALKHIEISTPIHIDLPIGGVPSHKTLLSVKGAEVTFENGQRLGPWDLEICGPERVRLTGKNGAGKSTLMKLAAKLIPLTNGQVKRAGHIAYLDQDLSLPVPEGTLVENMSAAHLGITEHQARSTLARYGFRNTTADRVVSGLSGGERLRLSLCLTTSGTAAPELLLLDEPTNHLDVASIELLENTLENYVGALVFVTHDEAFADAIAPSRTLEV